MRKIFLFISILSTVLLYGQKDTTIQKHHLSINPLNIVFFQQIGITYEYRPGIIGFAITPGYIYSNNKEYSNWFIAGPTNYGCLGGYADQIDHPLPVQFTALLPIRLTTPLFCS
ncbi:MAG: hypothetical protein NT040_04875 [Bacteroidetes bacterium]|nr:hypothetical protein [Bacteroidota bacterium]